MKIEQITILPILIGISWLIAIEPGLAQTGLATTPFCDDFNGTRLDTNQWVVMEKAWGVDNGGVVSDNVSISNGILHLTGHGDLYTGTVHGVNKKGLRVDRVTRVGAAIYTKNYFASGKYEVRMKLPQHFGACSTMWTFHYEEAYPSDQLYTELAQVGGLTASNLTWFGLTTAQGEILLKDLITKKGVRPPYLESPTNGIYHTTEYFRNTVTDISKLDLMQDFGKKIEIYTALKNSASLEPLGSLEEGRYIVRNQEIDIETPTGLKTNLSDISYGHARFNTWVGQSTGEFTDNFDDLGRAMNDGQFHVFRFDWHTANPTALSQRVEFYIDDKCYQTNYTHIPTIGGRFTLGIWFPTWTGTASFDSQSLDVDWVRITPFNENGDLWMKETD
jgi:beta-glucanase (GH16 family)